MQHLLICALVIINLICVNAQRPFYLGTIQRPTCVNEGEFCINNSDCCNSQICSSTNLSTSRCMANNATADTTTQQPSTTTLENRFNEASPDIQNCLVIEDSCKRDQECCSKVCIEGKCQNTQCSRIGQKCSSTARGCCDFLTCERGVCKDRSVFIEGTETFGYREPEADLNLNNRFGEGNSNQTVELSPCTDVGGRCTKHEDCCSNRCHSFLHQCVT